MIDPDYSFSSPYFSQFLPRSKLPEGSRLNTALLLFQMLILPAMCAHAHTRVYMCASFPKNPSSKKLGALRWAWSSEKSGMPWLGEAITWGLR